MKTILLQLDPDPHPSVFDAVVAVDCGVDRLLQYRGVEPNHVRDLVYGAIFTRGKKHLKKTAIFVGGEDVERGEQILDHVCQSFFGPLRVSVMLDANGANTTSAAAVHAAARHLNLSQCTATVLAGTGAVGTRTARLLASQGATVRIGSRSLSRAEQVIKRLADSEPTSSERLTARETNTTAQIVSAIDGASLVIAAGAAGVGLLSAAEQDACKAEVLIDLNAVPPHGIEWVLPIDSGLTRDSANCYGAIGIGELKMKIHREAIKRLFSANDLVLNVMEIFELGHAIAKRDWV